MYMSKSIIIDFETRSPHNIKDVGMFKYMNGAEVLCVAWKFVGDLYKDCDYIDFQNPAGYEGPIKRLKAIANDTNILFHAHNAQFEMLVWFRLMVEMGFPVVHANRWRCTAAAAAAKGLPRALDMAGDALNLVVQKSKDGRKAMLRLSKPTGIDEFGLPEFLPATPEAMQEVVEYCCQDVFAEEALYEKVGSLIPQEQAAFIWDFRVNSSGVPIDVELCKAAIECWSGYCEQQNKRITALTDSEITSYTQNVAIVRYVNHKFDLGIADATAACIDKTLEADNLHPTARELLSIRRKTAKTSIAKYSKMLDCVESDNRVRGCHIYHGASTGRWAGALVQFQNIKRGVLKESAIEDWINTLKSDPAGFAEACEMLGEDVGDILSSLIRSAICAYKGNKLLVCDFAGIEARGVAWLAGQTDLVEAFRQKQDIYVQFAGENIYKTPISSVTKDQRFVGKQAILGCGYGMGAKRFKEQCESYGVTLQLEFCEQVIHAYRTRYAKIKNLWADIEKAAVNAVKFSGQHYAANKKICYYVKDNFLVCRLPSGREICYYDPDLCEGNFGNDQINFMGLDSQTYKFRREQTYGGKLVENIVQAICRDLLVQACSNLESRGYEVIFHVHDEIVCEVPDHPRFNIREMETLMSQAPKWASDFPISTEGFEAKRYRK